jgi:murein DD-endopeptidase MepM/ murein hydrolase activator NlpD
MIKLACLAAAAFAVPCDSATAQWKDDLTFSRTYGASGVVTGSLEESALLAGVPPVAMVEPLRAFGAVLDVDQDVHDGDRFSVHYEQRFSLNGCRLPAGLVLWAELTLKKREPIEIFRFRPLGQQRDSFWFANGERAAPAELRLPVDLVSISSGFGPRPVPIDPLRLSTKRQSSVTVLVGAHSAAVRLGHGANGKVLLKPVNMSTATGALAHLPTPGKHSSLFHPMELHEGVDLVAPLGAPIHAAGDGTVVGAEPKARYGNWIEIEHDGGLSTVYGHLASYAPGIERGVSVRRGDVIGYVGTTGRTTGPHVHFELRVKGRPVDPISNAALKRPMLGGYDLERFRKLATQLRHFSTTRDMQGPVRILADGGMAPIADGCP